MNSKEFGRNHLWPNLRHNTDICLEVQSEKSQQQQKSVTTTGDLTNKRNSYLWNMITCVAVCSNLYTHTRERARTAKLNMCTKNMSFMRRTQPLIFLSERRKLQ